MRYQKSWILLLLFLFFVPELGGCAPAPPIFSGRDITEEHLKALASESISKSEMLDLLGPPYGIFKVGQKARVQRAPEWNAAGGITTSRNETVDSKAVFSLFKLGPEPSSENRVYYYYYSKSSKVGYVLGLAIIERVKNRTEELYVLVNEREEVVQDFFHHEGEDPGGILSNLF